MSESKASLQSGPRIEDDIRENFPVSVILQSRPSASRWADLSWQAVGVVVGSRHDQASDLPRLIHSEGEIRQYLCSGLDVALYIDCLLYTSDAADDLA